MSLISTIAEFKKYLAIDVNAKMQTLQPFIDEAEQLYMVPLLGQAFYDAATEAYDDVNGDIESEDFDADLKLLWPYIQRCLAYYTQVQAIPNLSVSFGELGVRQEMNGDNAPAPRWMIEKLQFAALKSGDTYADKLLEYLETNAASDKYGEWFGDIVANTKMSGSMVYSSTVASRHIAINNSRRVFLQLRNKIREIESRYVPKLIGKDQYDELVTQLQTGSVSAANARLITRLEPIIAKRALFMQLPFMRVQVNENGIFVYSGTDELIKPGMLASDVDIKILRQQLLEEKEFGYLADEKELQQFIMDNIADYPEIAATGVYTTQPDPGPTFQPTNSADNKHFIA